MNRKAKNGIKVLVSLVIAITMISIPANIFTKTTTAGGDIDVMPEKVTKAAYPTASTDEKPSVWITTLDEEFDGWSIAPFGGGYLLYILTTQNGWVERDAAYTGPYDYDWNNLWIVSGAHPEWINFGGAWLPDSTGIGSDLPGADSTSCVIHTGFDPASETFGQPLTGTLDFLCTPPIMMTQDISVKFDYKLIPNGGGQSTPLEVWAMPAADFDDLYGPLLVWDCQNGHWDENPNYILCGTFGNAADWTRADITQPLVENFSIGEEFVLMFKKDTGVVGETTYLDNLNVSFWTEHDVDATALVKPDPEMRHNTAPTEVWAEVTNTGGFDETNITVHLQIYKEIDYQPEIDWYDNMESCCVNWTATDVDGDGLTWERTDRRYNSPTHSWRVTGCNRATYAGNSWDVLTSKEITIPDWETKVWLNFSTWIQGEIAYTGVAGQYKYEDYLEVGIWVWNGTAWNYNIIDKYVDTDGEWMYPENMQDGTQRLNMWNADYDHWNCSKGSGAPWKWWGGIDLDPYLDNDPAGKRIKIEFRWISDPCHEFEGAYIDDVRLLSLRGPEQPLVAQGYKFIPALDQGESTIVSFPLDYTFDDGFWYFIEVYAWCENDGDGPGEDNGYNATIQKPGMEDPVTYYVPFNGFNESIYFGDVHDAAVTDIDAPSEVELEEGQCEETACADIPITVTVYNNGTLAEDIPVQVYAKERIQENLFWDDFESGTFDKWQGVYFQGDNSEYFDWWVTTYDPHTGSWHAMFGEPAGCGKMLPFALQGILGSVEDG